jgi:DNA-directed RNA polymerase specialized sigma24 family protein
MPITPADEQLLQAVFDWARRLFRRKGLNAQDAEDCAAEVRLHLLQHLQQGRPLSFAYAVRVAQGVLADSCRRSSVNIEPFSREVVGFVLPPTR